MTNIALKDIPSGYNVSRMTYNFREVEEFINHRVLHLSGGKNTMQQDLDMNNHSILNIGVDPGNPSSLLSIGIAYNLFLQRSGGNLTGPVSMGGNPLTGLPAPTTSDSPIRAAELAGEASARQAGDSAVLTAVDAEARARADGDAYLQSLLSGDTPLEASAFSPISWHSQQVEASVTIPEGKNAWSFGPVMTVKSGQTVTIGEGSFWTIADGTVVEEE